MQPLHCLCAAILIATASVFALIAQPAEFENNAYTGKISDHANRIIRRAEQALWSMRLAKDALPDAESRRLRADALRAVTGLREQSVRLQALAREPETPGPFVSATRHFETSFRRLDEILVEALDAETQKREAIERSIGAIGEARMSVIRIRAAVRSELQTQHDKGTAAAGLWPLIDRLSALDDAVLRLVSMESGFVSLRSARDRTKIEAIRTDVADHLKSLIRQTVDHQIPDFRETVAPAVSIVVAALNDPDRAFAAATRVRELDSAFDGAAAESARLTDVLAQLGEDLSEAARGVARIAAEKQTDTESDQNLLIYLTAILAVAVILMTFLYLRGRARRRENDMYRQTFEEVLDVVPQAYTIWRENGQLVYYNKKYAELRPEMLPYLEKYPTLTEYAKTAFELFKKDATPEEIAGNVEWALSEHAEDEQQVGADTWFQRSIRKTSNGWTVFVLNDISRRKRNLLRLENQAAELETANEQHIALEREATLAQERLEEAIEAIPNGFALWDGEDNLLYLNQRYRELRPDMASYLDGNPGFTEFARRSMRARLPDASEQEVEHILQSLLDRYEKGEMRDFLQSPGGLWLQMDIRRTGEGGYVAIFSDVTELFEARSQLSAAIENMQSGFILWGADERLLLVNEQARQMLPDRTEVLIEGTSLDDFATQSAKLRHPDAPDAEIEAKVQEIVDRFRHNHEPFELLESTGRWHLVHINPIETDEIVSVIVDITDQKRIQTRLEQQTDELQRSNRELEQFAYLASHDLQEPLRVVSSYCDLINRRYADALDADGREFLAYAVDGAQRMRSLIDDLLTYSRAGRGKLSVEPFDLKTAVEQASNSLQTLIAENGATLEVDDLPRVTANPALFSQVFQNLISNGIKFRREENPHIRISAARKGADWVIRVSDNGIGIKEEFSERVFRIFQRLHTRDEFAGNGLGLALCQRIVVRHGGRIWVEPPDGPGTTISFTIPVAPVAASTPAEEDLDD